MGYGGIQQGFDGSSLQLVHKRGVLLAVPAPVIGLAVAEDHSGGGHIAESIATTPQPELAVPTTNIYTSAAIDGAIADDGGAQTDETTEANNATVNDMTLLPAVPAVNDAYYWGLLSVWDWLALLIGQAGVGTWTVIYEYWNGASWATLPSWFDTSNGFRNAGYHSITFARPLDWATSNLMLMNLYWIRARITAYTSITTQPLGTQAWIGTH